MTVVRRTVALAAALGALLLAGCNDEEQGRAVHLDKGVYQGAADTPLNAGQIQALQQRSAGQRF